MTEKDNAEALLLDVGDRAPDFTLMGSTGEPVTLSEFEGGRNVCLIFYPKDETPGCTRQLCMMRDAAERFIGAGVERFGVNPGSLQSHQRFAQKEEIDFPLLVDADLTAARNYGALGPDDESILRTVYLIDRDGRVAFRKRGFPEADEILGALES